MLLPSAMLLLNMEQLLNNNRKKDRYLDDLGPMEKKVKVKWIGYLKNTQIRAHISVHLMNVIFLERKLNTAKQAQPNILWGLVYMLFCTTRFNIDLILNE